MEVFGLISLILGVMGMLAFIRINKLEDHLKSKGVIEPTFDSLDDLGNWGNSQSHERRERG